MRVLAIALGLCVVPTLASARPLTAGVSIGRAQSKVDADTDASHSLGVFGRLGLTSRLSGQLELQKLDTATMSTTVRIATALIVVELGSGKHLVPILVAGAGLDHAETTYGPTTTGNHIEGGFGLEYRADGGFTLGADVRMGGRSIDGDGRAVLQPTEGDVLYYPDQLPAGEYRSARITAAVRF